MRPKKRLFGTDGIRGVPNGEPMTAETALKLGRAIAHIFKKKPYRHRIVIGKDTRLSGYMLESAMMAGVCSMGVDALMIGPLPTPGIAFITSNMRADAGVVISASHNQYQDNGIKFFSRDGFKLSDALELEIEKFVFGNHDKMSVPTAKEVGKAFRIDDAQGRYVVFVKNTFPKELTLDGFRIVVDCVNGAAYKVAPEVLYELGAEVISLGVNPDGENINLGCGALHTEALQKEVKRAGADIGIALDGDGDRCVLVDEKGNIKEGRLNKKTVVSTIMSNAAFDVAIEKMGGRVVRTDVGDRYVVEELAKNGYNFGGERSGHIVFFDHTTTGDGIITALQVLSVMVKENKSLSELAKIMTPFPQVLLNVKVREKKDLDGIALIKNALEKVKAKLKGRGRAFIRYSGTEPLARITVEGEREEEIKAMAEELASVLRKELA